MKLGFIVEGDCEKIVLEKSDFFSFLDALAIPYEKEVINATGNGNLLPHRIQSYKQMLFGKDVTNIVILTDLDDDRCITLTKDRIGLADNHIVIVSVKELESWYLADTHAMQILLEDPGFECHKMEEIQDPLEEIQQLCIGSKSGRGFRRDKVILANRMVRNGFSIPRAAQHPDCHSARYFVQKLEELAQSTTS